MVELDSTWALLRVIKRRGGGVLRKLDFSDANVVQLTVTKRASRSSQHGPFVVISVPKNYDVVCELQSLRIKNKNMDKMTQVLRLQSENHWIQFRNALSSCLNQRDKLLKEIEAENDVLLEAAETKDKRQAKLGYFFRQAYSKVIFVIEGKYL